MPTTTRPAPTRQRRKEARPAELLEAALALFVEKGYAATRVEEVAARAGVSKGTLFLYFPSKEELFKAVVRENITGLLDTWNRELVEFQGSSAELVRYGLHSWWERIGMTPASGITKLIMSEAHNFPEIAAFYKQAVIEPGEQLLRRLLQRGVERREFRASLDLDHAVYGLIAPMMFLLMWKHSMGVCVASDKPLDPVAFIDSQVDLLMHGLCRDAPPEGKPTPR